MMDMNGLFVWTLGSVIQVIRLISTLNKLFVSHLSITWIMTYWIQGNNRILTITWITCISRFLFISCLDQFCLDTSWNPMSMGLCTNTSDKNLKPIYVIKHTSNLCEWLLQSVTQRLDQLNHQGSFVCVSITWINGSVIHFSKQNSP